MGVGATAALNEVFRDASERFEKAVEAVADLTVQLSATKQAIAQRKGVFDDLEASWIYGEGLYATCKNDNERKAILALKRKGDPEFQVETVRQRDDEAKAARLEGQLELHRGTMSLMKRRMDYAIGSRLLEAYSQK